MMDPEQEAAVWARVRAAGGRAYIPPEPACEPAKSSAAGHAAPRPPCPSPRLLLAAAVLCLAVCRQSCRIYSRPVGQ